MSDMGSMTTPSFSTPWVPRPLLITRISRPGISRSMQFDSGGGEFSLTALAPFNSIVCNSLLTVESAPF
jgi:hypothetical protein